MIATPHPMTKIKSMHQVDFIDETHLLFDCRTKRPCVINRGVLLIGDGGVIVCPEVLAYYDIHYFPLMAIEGGDGT